MRTSCKLAALLSLVLVWSACQTAQPTATGAAKDPQEKRTTVIDAPPAAAMRAIPPRENGTPASAATTEIGLAGATQKSRATDQFTHNVDSAENTRMSLLELYQKVVLDRDQLAGDLEDARAALKREEQDRAGDARNAAIVTERTLELEKRVAELETQNLDLAGRLTTAQIRRLEAEKILLETLIGKRTPVKTSKPLEGAAPAAAKKTGSHP